MIYWAQKSLCIRLSIRQLWMQGRHGWQDFQDIGLAWILQSRKRQRQWWAMACCWCNPHCGRLACQKFAVVALVCIEGFYVCQTLFELLSWYHHLPPTQPVNSSDRQSKNIIHNRNFIPAPLASQSAPLMNTCWPVLRTCNSNTFVLFWASCIHKKNFYNPKITPLQIMFSKRFFLLLRRKKISLQITLLFFT